MLNYISRTIKQLNLRQWVVLFIFGLFLVTNSAYLSSVPGLLGDEGDEGHNVQELLNKTKPAIQGERSYIGVWIDYLRIPFVFVFGHNTLSLRIIALLFSIAFFWLAYDVLLKIFGEIPGLFGLIALAFSPIYWSEMRIGWAITLLPFFAILTIYLFRKKTDWSPLLAGISAGFGLSTHILFLPVLTAILCVFGIIKLVPNFSLQKIKQLFAKTFVFLIGFWAIFCVQFVNLLINNLDQGNIEKTAGLFSTRLSELFSIAPRFLSGSLFIAQYTARTFNDSMALLITIILLLLIIFGFIFSKHKFAMAGWLIGLSISYLVLVYMIEYYAIRYFIIITLGTWLMAGIGLGEIIGRLRKKISYSFAVILSVVLIITNLSLIIIPFLATSGSNDTFPIIGTSRFEYASGRVATAPLIGCISSLDQIFSNNVHIRNRLYYLADGNPQIRVAKRKQDVRWLISYRMPNDKILPNEVCPYLKNFRVTPTNDMGSIDWPKD
ncbi:MAG: glycosyltransferase family 39 protein [bacterium]|nr:glycosyltransferase family 39 protein [bacterium]